MRGSILQESLRYSFCPLARLVRIGAPDLELVADVYLRGLVVVAFLQLEGAHYRLKNLLCSSLARAPAFRG